MRNKDKSYFFTVYTI